MNDAYPAGEVDFHGEDTDILGTGKVVVFGGDDGYGRDGHGLKDGCWQTQCRDYIGESEG